MNDDLISRADVKRLTTQRNSIWNKITDAEGRELDEILDSLLSIDAVPVVRCKDCKYWYREIYNGIEYFNFNYCDLNHHGDGRDFYCADAERKKE